MSQWEQAIFKRLPQFITIFRGCGPNCKWRCFWSLNRESAMRFPCAEPYRTKQPILLTATINNQRAAALKLGRGESRRHCLRSSGRRLERAIFAGAWDPLNLLARSYPRQPTVPQREMGRAGGFLGQLFLPASPADEDSRLIVVYRSFGRTSPFWEQVTRLSYDRIGNRRDRKQHRRGTSSWSKL